MGGGQEGWSGRGWRGEWGGRGRGGGLGKGDGEWGWVGREKDDWLTGHRVGEVLRWWGWSNLGRGCEVD